MRNSLSSHWSSTPQKKITMNLQELARFTDKLPCSPQTMLTTPKTRIKQPLDRILTKSQILEGYLKIRPKFVSRKTSTRKVISRSTSVKEIVHQRTLHVTESTIPTQTVSPRVPMKSDIQSKLNMLLNREYNQDLHPTIYTSA